MDGFTKYCILKPLKTLDGQELVSILRENLTLFGTPTRIMIVTDRGTNFISDHVRSLLRDMQINPIHNVYGGDGCIINTSIPTI